LGSATGFKVLFVFKRHLIFLGLLTMSCNPNLDGLFPSRSDIIKNQVKWQADLYFPRIKEFQDSPIGFKKIVFLGNSITQGGGDWNERFKTNNIVNRGISGDFTTGVLARLDEVTYFQPKAIFLLIGINDIFGINDPKISSNYVFEQINKISAMISIKSPETKLYIQTILPVDEKKYLKVKGFFPTHDEPLAKKIIDINQRLLKMHDKNYNVINLYNSFIDNDGNVKEYLFEDGVHLSDQGYDMWVSILEKYIYQFEKKNI